MKKGAFPSKILYHKRDIRRVKGRRIVDKKRCSEPIHARTRYWTRRQRLRAKCQQIDAKSDMSEERFAHVIQFLSDLRLPFLAPSIEQSELSHEQLLKRLHWLINPEPSRRGPIKYRVDQEVPLDPYARSNGPFWNLPPTRPPNSQIENFLGHLHTTLSKKKPLAIPAAWSVFDGIHWEAPFVTDDTDSGRPWISRLRDSSPKPAKVEETTAGHKYISINCMSNHVNQARLRNQWELLVSMDPLKFHWSYQTEEKALRRQQVRYTKGINWNQQSLNRDIWPQASVMALFQLYEAHDPSKPWEYVSMAPLGEIKRPQELGRLVARLVSTDAFPSGSHASLKWPKLLSQIRHPPVIDYTCVAKLPASKSQGEMDLLLFAAHYRDNNEKAAIQALALAFQPMMTLLTLYHLDTRTSRDDLMPWWMCLFGVIYDEKGISIEAFTPAYQEPRDVSSNGEIGWRAETSSFSRKFRHHMGLPPHDWSGMIASLYRIQSHCSHVLEQLRSWDGYERICTKFNV